MWCRYFDNDFLKQKNTHIRSGNHHESNQCAPDTPRIVFVLNARGTLKPSFNMIFAILSLSPGLFVSLYPGCCLCLSPWLCLALMTSLPLSIAPSPSDSVFLFHSLHRLLTLSSSSSRSILFFYSVHPLLSPGLWVLFFLLSEFVSTSSSVHSHSQFADCIVGELLILLNLITFLNIRIVCNFFLTLTLNDFKMIVFFHLVCKTQPQTKTKQIEK